MSDSNHAIENGRGWLATIGEALEALDKLESGEAESVSFDGGEYDDAESVRDRIQEMPLSVEVRSDWHTPGSHGPASAPAEYCILLTTGGPALRVIGSLSEYCEPDSARLEWQDWGTPWTHLHLSDDDAAAILRFAGFFYYGEG